MHIKQVCLLVLVVVLGAGNVSAAGNAPQLTPNVVDESADVSQDTAWLGRLQASLGAIQSNEGIRVLVQFHAKSPPDNEDQHPGDYMRALSAKLGVIQQGILMVHFADDPDWRVWIGDGLTPKFVGKPGNAKEFTENGEMHDAKEAVLTTAMADAARKYALLNLPKMDAKTPASGVLLRLQAGAIVDGLKAKFAH
ncbi:MAG TPA: hypothetical protein VFE25_14930 [Opitutaceae bacterium]|jgi:hypothetical protein|nr:hypothetical protein [Opitutaceae bacterium]